MANNGSELWKKKCRSYLFDLIFFLESENLLGGGCHTVFLKPASCKSFGTLIDKLFQCLNVQSLTMRKAS